MIATAGETTQFGCLYLIDADGDTKVGITQQERIVRRVENLQTGNPQRLRVVMLCLFYSRDIAAVVERSLKDRHAVRRAQGGTEWFDVPRAALRQDIVAIAHDLAVSQIKANSMGVEFSRPELSEYFYGLLILDIVAGEIRHQWDATPYADVESADARPPTPVSLCAHAELHRDATDKTSAKIDFWNQLRHALLPRMFR